VAVYSILRQVLVKLQAAYNQTPTLQLTAEQAERLCEAEAHICLAALDALVMAGILSVQDGVYVRTPASPAESSRVRQAMP